MKKRLVSLLLTVIMTVSLVPFSAISVFAADGTAGTAAALTAALASAGDGETVKLTANVTDTSVAYTLPAGVTLDLDGHKFAYKSIETKAVGSRVVDSSAGKYEISDYLFTNGRQFLTTGLSSHEVSGLSAAMTAEKPNMSGGNVTFFGSYYSGGTDRYQLLVSGSGSATATSLQLRGGWISPNNGTASNAAVAKTVTVASSNFGKKFTYDFYLDSAGKGHATFGGALSGTGTTSVAVYDRSAKKFAMNLLASNAAYSTLTQKCDTQYTGVTDTEQGRNSWYGKTYYAKIYCDEVDGNVTPSRDYVAAKSVATGMIGMFDKAEGLFYPLLGLTQYASVSECNAILTLKANGSFTEVSYIATASALTSALEKAESGETVKLDADIAASTTSFTIPAGVTLDLNGHTFTYKAIEQTIPNPTNVASTNIDCVSTASRVIDTAAGQYDLYDYLFVNGRQFITTGLTAADLTGLSGTVTLDKPMSESAGHGFCGGYMQPYVGGAKKTIRFYWGTNQLSSGKDPAVGKYDTATANNTSFYALWYANSSYGTAIANVWQLYKKDAGVETPTVNNLGKQFTFNTVLRDGYLRSSCTGAVTSAGTVNSATLYDRSTYNWSLNLLNVSGQGAIYSTITQKGSGNYTALSDEQQGRTGWYGKVYAAKMYSDNSTDFTTNNADALVRDYVPARSVATGMIGMFDKVYGVFYPLLGLTQYASLSDNTTAELTLKSNGSYTIRQLIRTAADLDAALNAAKSGDTVKIDADIEGAEYDYTLKAGVKLDLNGYALAANTFTATDTDALIDSSENGDGRVTVVETNGFSCTGKDFSYPKESGSYKVVESVAHKLNRANAACQLTEDYETEDDVVLASGVVLDLNGYEFNANSLDARAGKVIDSTLADLADSTEGTPNCSGGSVVLAEDEKFQVADSNPYCVVDNGDDTYNLRKYEITYLPGEATGWTLGSAFDAESSRYIQYALYGEKITLSKMIYTAEDAHIAWKQEEDLFEGSTPYATAITQDITFTTDLKTVAVNGTAYASWADAVNAIKVSATVTIYGNVKLTADLTDKTVKYVFGNGATLDLNGHKFAYASLDVRASRSAVIDTSVGEYTFYDSITTTGKQFITTGLSMMYDLTGLNTKTSSRREYGSGGWTSFMGGATLKVGTTTNTYANSNYWIPLGLRPASTWGLQARWCYNNGSTVKNCVDKIVAWGDATTKIAVGTSFTWDWIGNSGVQKLTVNGKSVYSQVNSTTFPTSDQQDANVLLFNDINADYSQLTRTADYKLFSTDATVNTNAAYGRIGWDGTTEYAKIYKDTAGTTANTTLVRDYVPAKSSASGMIGMFDKVNGVFYPLLGEAEYASVNGTPVTYSKRSDNSLYKVSVSGGAELTSVLSGIRSGETIHMMNNITFSGNLVIPAGVSLDLNGYRLTATNVTATAAGAYVIDRTFSGGVTVTGDFTKNDHEDYEFVTSDNKVYTIKPNWVTRLRKAESGETVVLTENLSDSYDYVLAEGATLDLNGHTMTVGSLNTAKGNVIDSTITAVDNTGAAKNEAASKITADFTYSNTNTFQIVDGGNGTYTVRKYTLKFFPGEASGWTMTETLGELDEDSVYEMYCTYGETTLPDMIYTGSVSAVWYCNGSNAEPGSICSVNDDMKFTAKFVALSVTIGKSTTYYPSANMGTYAQIKALTLDKSTNKITILSSCKLTCDWDLSSFDVTLDKNVTLDLNGKSFTYKSINTNAAGCRIIDSAPGSYIKYEYLYTNGRQYLPLGISSKEFSGIKAEFTVDKPNLDTGNPGFLSGYYTGGTDRIQILSIDGQSAANKGSTTNNTSGLRGGWICNAANSAVVVKSASCYVVKSGTESVNKLGQKYGFEFFFTKNGATVNWTGAVTATGTSTAGVFDQSGLTAFNFNLLNVSNMAVSTYTQRCDYQWSGLPDSEQGRNGWCGKTYFADIYANEVGGNKNAVRKFVAAKNMANGMIGMFDTVENVFYPLLGITQYAFGGNEQGIIMVTNDGTKNVITETTDYETTDYGTKIKIGEHYNYLVDSADFFTSGDSAAVQSGDTVTLNKELTVAGSVTLPNGSTLDLNGHSFTVNAINAGYLVDNAKANAALYSSSAYYIGTDDFNYVEEDGAVYVCRKLSPCMNEDDFSSQVSNAIARDTIRLGADILCTRTSYGYAVADSVSILPLGDYRIHYYAKTPQALSDLLSNSNSLCTIHLKSDFTEKKDVYAIPEDTVLLFDGYTFASKVLNSTEIEDDGTLIGYRGKGIVTGTATDLTVASRLLSATGTYKLEADINDTRDYVLGDGVTLDLNGHNIVCNSFDASNGYVIDSAKRGGHTITVTDTENTVFRSAETTAKTPNLHHYTVSDDQTVYTFYPYTITYYPGYANAWNAATVATEGAFKPGVPYIQEVTRGQNTLAGSIFSNSYYDYAFVKWNTEATMDGEQISAGSIRNISQDLILYAQFAKCYFTTGGTTYYYNDLKAAMQAAKEAGFTGTLYVVGNTEVNGDLTLYCEVAVRNSYVTLTINGNLELNGKACWGNGANSALKVKGAVTDNTYGNGYITHVATGIATILNPDDDYMEVIYDLNSYTYHRFYSTDSTLYFDQANTKLISGEGEHADQKAMIFQLQESFKKQVPLFLKDDNAHVYIHLTLTNSKFFTFRADDNSALFFAKKTADDTWTLDCSWDITELLRNESVPTAVDNIYAVLHNGADTLKSADAQILVTVGEQTIQGSTVTTGIH